MSRQWMENCCFDPRKVASMLLAGGLGLILSCRSIPPPAMSLAAGRNTITAGASTTLTAYLPGGGGTGTIDQGIGTVSNGVPVTIAPVVDTTYTLTFTGYFGTLTAATTVDVAALPVITGFTAASSLITAGSGTTLTATFSGGTGSVDQGIGPVTSGVPVPTGNLSSGVTYTLTVTNPGGTAVTATASVALVGAPTTPVITAPAAATTGSAGLIASVPVEPGCTYAWTITGGSITAGAGTPSITFTAGTSGSVVLGCTVTNAAGTGSVPGTATCAIVAAPSTPVITAPATVTAGAAGVAASVPAQSAGSSYAWTITGGSITTGAGTASITFTAGASGSVVLGCTVTNAAGAVGAPGTATVAIVAAPTTPVITAPAAVTAGTTGNLASIPAQTGSTYVWTVSDGTITAGAGTISITFTAGTDAGPVTLGCTVSNAGGTASTPGSATVAIVAAPTATITGPSGLAPGSTGNTASVLIQPGSTYAWTIGDGTITAGGSAATITFTAGTDAGPTLLTCVVTNSLGAVSAPGTDSIPIDLALVDLLVSDASTEDWASIQVRVLGIGLIPMGGTSAGAVQVYSAPSPAPLVNLVELDQLGQLLSQTPVAPGTYSGAVLTLGGNPGDVVLVTAANPSAGFPGPAATTIPAGQIQIQGASGSPGSLTVPVTVDFAAPLVVAAGQGNTLDLEFDLSHPALIVDHQAAGDSAPLWAVCFNGPVRQHPAAATDLVLRHIYGTVAAISAAPSALIVTLDNPGIGPSASRSLTILPDTRDGTMFWDLDAGTSGSIMDFTGAASTLPGKFVRIAARFQADGSLVAARLWASAAPAPVQAGPEGHLLHVDSGAGILTVEDSSGIGVPIQVGAATQFFFHHAAVPIGTGAGFLGTGLVRGFKVHASVDPTTTPMTARTVDIEAARYDGVLSALGGASFACTRTFSNAADDYSVNLTFCLAAAGSGAEFWTAVAGGVPAAMPPRGVSYATWNDAAAPSAWSAESACLEPIALPMGTVATAWSGTGFGLALPGGGSPVAVNLDFSSSPAPSVYRVDRTGGTVTVTPVDPTTAVGQSELASSFVPGTVVKVYATPGSAGGVNAHALFYYTGTLPLPFHD